MLLHRFLLFACAALFVTSHGHAEDTVKRVKKAIEQSTLDQLGTAPFHLKATLAPSREGSDASSCTGEVELWWKSPTSWRREVRSPEFHQIEIVDGNHVWQKNEGTYFPEWLRELAEAIIRPVPQSEELYPQVKDAKERRLLGVTYLSWRQPSGDASSSRSMDTEISIRDDSGLLFSSTGFGWGGWYREYAKFHNRKVARSVSNGAREIMARIITLEDLGTTPPGWFDATAPGNAERLDTELLSEAALRKNLLPEPSAQWPPVQDGPLEGVITTEVSIDSKGNVREIGTLVSDNPGLNTAAYARIEAMRFNPFLRNGEAVQVHARVTVDFKTVRPTTAPGIESARTWFERGRQADFPAFIHGGPYTLKATFQFHNANREQLDGQYEDTWVSDAQWRREATAGKSRFVRTQNGEETYLLSEGPDARLLALVLQILEPIPSIDTFVESDWRIKSELLGTQKTIRVFSGNELPNGKPDADHARGFWFTPSGDLVKTYFDGIETLRRYFEPFGTTKIARQIDVERNGSLAMRILITEISPGTSLSKDKFVLKGHEWKRAFVTEVR